MRPQLDSRSNLINVIECPVESKRKKKHKTPFLVSGVALVLVSFLRICLVLLTIYDLFLFLFLVKTDCEVSEKSEGALRDAYINQHMCN